MRPRSLPPSPTQTDVEARARAQMTALQRDLDEYLTEYNYHRARTGRLTQGRVPANIVFGASKRGQRDEHQPSLHLVVRTN